ncbi:MAG: hypothetical protein HC824_11745 [Synechococcales cyanobacterium RM1_1_8]|nr:hypothetical protein [Synechococcales cyanobacterium RM1_1_8]
MPETDLEGIEFQPLGNPFLAKLMTPVGVGAALLVLVGGSVAGYLLSNPSSVSHLSIGRFFPENSTAQGADNAQAAGSAGPSAGPKVIPAELPPGAPDLTQREFIQLSLSNLGTIDPQGNPIYSPFSLGGLGSPGSLAARPLAQPWRLRRARPCPMA